MKVSFTLIELVLAIAIVVVLAAAAAPLIATSSQDAKTAAVVALWDSLTKAGRKFYADTDSGIIEDSSSDAVSVHVLSRDSGLAGWQGPYISHPLSAADNPYNGRVIFSGTFRPLAPSGEVFAYILDVFNIPANAARAINDRYEPGEGENWYETGTVRYVAGSQHLRFHPFADYEIVPPGF